MGAGSDVYAAASMAAQGLAGELAPPDPGAPTELPRGLHKSQCSPPLTVSAHAATLLLSHAAARAAGRTGAGRASADTPPEAKTFDGAVPAKLRLSAGHVEPNLDPCHLDLVSGRACRAVWHPWRA